MANFTPNLKPYSGQGKFRYWVQMVLPTIYDDSLSYMELLNKVVYVINLAIEDIYTVEENVAALLTAFEELQQFTNDYFYNLDVQEEINNKLDGMAESGELLNLVKPYIDSFTSSISNDIDVLVARMDSFTNLPEGSTTGDAELLDIRVSYDGKTYPTAGDSVRTQALNLNEKTYGIGEIDCGLFEGYINPNGTIHVPTDKKEICTEYIECVPGDCIEIDVYFNTTTEIQGFYAFRYNNDTYTRFTIPTLTSNKLKQQIEIPENVTNVAISFTTNENPYVIHVYKWQSIEKYLDVYPQVIKNNEVTFTYESGYIDNRGNVLPSPPPESAVYTQIVEVQPNTSIYYDLHLENILNYNETEISTSYYLLWKNDGSCTRYTIPVNTYSPTRTNRRYGYIEIPADVIGIQFWWRTYGYNFKFKCYTTLNNSYTYKLINNLPNIKSKLNELIFSPLCVTENMNKRLNSDGTTSNTTSNIGVSNYYEVIPGDKITYKLSNLSTGCIFVTYDNFYKVVNYVEAEGYTNYIEGEHIFTADEKYIRFGGVSYLTEQYTLIYNNYPLNLETLNKKINSVNVVNNPFSYSPYLSHTLIDKINGVNVIIPSESIFNVEMDSRLGFKVVEGNVHKTSDGEYVVMHGVSNTFGNQVEHIDGTTNISNIRFDAVTLEWIKENVRYKSLYPKFRVAPPTLEEWLIVCKQNNIMPFVTANTQEMTDRIKNIMGDYFIGYNATRNFTNGMIVHYRSDLTSAEEMLNYCENIGKPFMLSIGNSSSFTDEQLKEISDLLHINGYLIGVAGAYIGEEEWQRCWKNGFDFSGAGWNTPTIQAGNLVNIVDNINFTGLTTNGSISEGSINLAANNTVQLSEIIPTQYLATTTCEICFVGDINVKIGNYINNNFSNDGTDILQLTTYHLNQAPDLLITANSNTTIKTLIFKSSAV